MWNNALSTSRRIACVMLTAATHYMCLNMKNTRFSRRLRNVFRFSYFSFVFLEVWSCSTFAWSTNCHLKAEKWAIVTRFKNFDFFIGMNVRLLARLFHILGYLKVWKSFFFDQKLVQAKAWRLRSDCDWFRYKQIYNIEIQNYVSSDNNLSSVLKLRRLRKIKRNPFAKENSSLANKRLSTMRKRQTVKRWIAQM